MGLIEGVRNLIAPSGTATRGDYHECRRCGSTLTAEDDACLTCGAEDVASFDL